MLCIKQFVQKVNRRKHLGMIMTYGHKLARYIRFVEESENGQVTSTYAAALQQGLQLAHAAFKKACKANEFVCAWRKAVLRSDTYEDFAAEYSEKACELSENERVICYCDYFKDNSKSIGLMLENKITVKSYNRTRLVWNCDKYRHFGEFYEPSLCLKWCERDFSIENLTRHFLQKGKWVILDTL